ncbi:hypothetical protein AB1N83_011819 [Pleurotus pulmonarius]
MQRSLVRRYTEVGGASERLDHCSARGLRVSYLIICQSLLVSWRRGGFMEKAATSTSSQSRLAIDFFSALRPRKSHAFAKLPTATEIASYLHEQAILEITTAA